MASNKWLRDFEAGVSKRQSGALTTTRRHTPRMDAMIYPDSPPVSRGNIIKPLTFGDFYEPVEKKYSSSIGALKGHRPRCKRQIASSNNLKQSLAKSDPTQTFSTTLTSDKYKDEKNIQDMQQNSPQRPTTSEPLSTRELVFNLGALGRTRSGAEIVKRIGETEIKDNQQNHELHITPVRSEEHRLLRFEPRRSSAPTTPMVIEEPKEEKKKIPSLKSTAQLVQAIGIMSDRSQLQKQYAENLAKPRIINEKVVTDGTDKTMWELIELKGSRSPGPSDYDNESNLKAMEAPSGGRFNMSCPKTDIEWNIKRSAEIPDPGSYVLDRPKTSGGRFNMSMPLSDIEVKILRAKETPGAGEYNQTVTNNRGGGRFNVSKSKSDIEWKIYTAKQLPGPGEYKVQTPVQRGGRFNEARPQSDVEVRIRRASLIPGPGEYSISEMKTSGGKFNASNLKSDIEQKIFDAARTPGPSDYVVKDDIVKKKGHTGKFPFIYRPKEQSPSLKKFATAVNTIKTMNRLKGNGGLKALATKMSEGGEITKEKDNTAQHDKTGQEHVEQHDAKEEVVSS